MSRRSKVVLPFAVDIAGREYAMGFVSEEEASEGHYLGLCHNLRQTISISPTHYTPESMLDTVMHEVLHAVWYQYRLHSAMTAPEDVREEAIVDTLGSALTQVLTKNPALRRLIEQVSKTMETPS